MLGVSAMFPSASTYFSPGTMSLMREAYFFLSSSLCIEPYSLADFSCSMRIFSALPAGSFPSSMYFSALSLSSCSLISSDLFCTFFNSALAALWNSSICSFVSLWSVCTFAFSCTCFRIAWGMFPFSRWSILKFQYLIMNPTSVSFVLHEWDSHDPNWVGLHSFSHFSIIAVTVWSSVLYCFIRVGDHSSLDCAIFVIFSSVLNMLCF